MKYIHFHLVLSLCPGCAEPQGLDSPTTTADNSRPCLGYHRGSQQLAASYSPIVSATALSSHLHIDYGMEHPNTRQVASSNQLVSEVTELAFRVSSQSEKETKRHPQNI